MRGVAWLGVARPVVRAAVEALRCGAVRYEWARAAMAATHVIQSAQIVGRPGRLAGPPHTARPARWPQWSARARMGLHSALFCL